MGWAQLLLLQGCLQLHWAVPSMQLDFCASGFSSRCVHLWDRQCAPRAAISDANRATTGNPSIAGSWVEMCMTGCLLEWSSPCPPSRLPRPWLCQSILVMWMTESRRRLPYTGGQHLIFLGSIRSRPWVSIAQWHSRPCTGIHWILWRHSCFLRQHQQGLVEPRGPTGLTCLVELAHSRWRRCFLLCVSGWRLSALSFAELATPEQQSWPRRSTGPVLFSFDCFETGTTPTTFRCNSMRAGLEDSDSVSALCKHCLLRWVKNGNWGQGVPNFLWFQGQAQLSLFCLCKR